MAWTEQSRRLNGIALTICCGLLSACASVISMPDGRTTTMNEAAIAARFARPIAVGGTVTMPDYQAGLVCSYSLDTHVDEAAGTWTWTTRAVRDRIHVQMVGPNSEPSTVLIGRDGELFDFNIVDVFTGERETSENYQSLANAKMAANPNARVINTVELVLPHRLVSTANYGDVIGRIFDRTGAVWAQFVYAGSTTYEGRQGLVLDLVRLMPSMGNRPIVVGFAIVDAANALPLLTNVQAGARYHLEQRACSGPASGR